MPSTSPSTSSCCARVQRMMASLRLRKSYAAQPSAPPSTHTSPPPSNPSLVEPRTEVLESLVRELKAEVAQSTHDARAHRSQSHTDLTRMQQLLDKLQTEHKALASNLTRLQPSASTATTETKRPTLTMMPPTLRRSAAGCGSLSPPPLPSAPRDVPSYRHPLGHDEPCSPSWYPITTTAHGHEQQTGQASSPTHDDDAREDGYSSEEDNAVVAGAGQTMDI